MRVDFIIMCRNYHHNEDSFLNNVLHVAATLWRITKQHNRGGDALHVRQSKLGYKSCLAKFSLYFENQKKKREREENIHIEGESAAQ